MKPILIAHLLLTATMAMACANDMQGNPPQGGEQKRREPPPEAYTACQGKKAGDAVMFKTPRGDTVKATCREIPARLVAVPERPPRQDGKGDMPPPQQ